MRARTTLRGAVVGTCPLRQVTCSPACVPCQHVVPKIVTPGTKRSSCALAHSPGAEGFFFHSFTIVPPPRGCFVNVLPVQVRGSV